MGKTNNILALLDRLTSDTPQNISRQIADDFRARRVEKNISRRQMAEISGVPYANITRFEKTGLISLDNLVKLALRMGYNAEIKSIFAEPKFSTMAELEQIQRNSNKKKAYTRHAET